jgi:2',3'-cyclic-nucleotide 2'-phosphodiesterase (5'-nucleotidase family)
MEALSHYLKEIRKTNKNVLVVDKGDVMTGTFASAIEYNGVIGGAMIEFLNRLDYDLWSYGNHEFDKGQANALRMAEIAEFPTILANVTYKEDKNKNLFAPKPYSIIDAEGVKVGFIAVMEENFLVEVHSDKVVGLDVLPIVPTLHSHISELDKRTDLLVVIVHSSFKDGVRVAKEVPGIDVVLVASEDGQFQEVNGVLVQSTRGHMRTLGYLKLEVENDRVVDYEERLIWLWADEALNPSPQISSFVKMTEGLIGEECKRVVGEAKSDLKKLDYPLETNHVCSPLGNWITDVMRWKTKAHIALHNSGAIRSSVYAGSICIQDIFEVAPFNNTLILFKLSGKQLKNILEIDVDREKDKLQVSGLVYWYHDRETKKFGERIDTIKVNGEVVVKDGQVLLPDRMFTVVSNDYVVGHAEDKYFGFPLLQVKDTKFPLDQTMVEWLEEHKVLDYKFEERIIKITDFPRARF